MRSGDPILDLKEQYIWKHLSIEEKIELIKEVLELLLEKYEGSRT